MLFGALVASGVGLLPDRSLAAAHASSNLLVGDQATFQSSTGGWVGYAVSLSQAASPSDVEPGSLLVTPNGSASVASAWSGIPSTCCGQQAPSAGTVPSPNLTRAVPGLVYSASAEVMSGSSSTVPVDAAIGFWDSSGSPLVYVPGQSSAVGGTWSPTTATVAVAPPTAAYVAMAVEVRNASGTWSLSVDDASLVSTTDTVAAVAGPLRTSGTQILDANGQPVILRGIDYYGLATSSEPPSLTSDTFTKLHQWGANEVRVSLNEDFWLPQSCAYDANYPNEVTQAVNWITQLGMVALLDDHLANPADLTSGSSCASQTQQLAPDYPGADTFWASVASMFKGNPLVAFDLFNEPHNVSLDIWRLGGVANGQQYEGMQELYGDVRRAGATNLVFVEGNDWANTPPKNGYLISGYDIVYDVHWYSCPDNPPPTCTDANGDPTTDLSTLQNWVTFQSQQQQPVFVGEFGWPDNTNGTFIGNVINFADTQNWGWDVFAYDGGTHSPFALVQYIPTSGPLQPSGSGMPVLADLALHTPQPPPAFPNGSGYWMAASDGGVFAFGLPFLGSMGGTKLNAPIVAMESAPAALGYWLVASDGGVFSFGGATYAGSMGGTPLAAPVISMAADAVTGGYWLVASDGGVFAFNAPFFGSTGNIHLNKPIVAAVPTPDGLGYWLVASDGGVFAFGDAPYLGSMGGTPLNQPIVTAQTTPDGQGYWLTAADGGVFAFGDAAFFGSTGNIHLNKPIVAMTPSPDGGGYRLVASDGGVFAYGDAPFQGSLGGTSLVRPVIAATAPPWG
ncbi:MAG: glycoside hydrolase family 5 protein [Acidimicrobiales bacterium]